MHLNVIKLMQIPLCGATPPLSLRWGFETTSIHFHKQTKGAQYDGKNCYQTQSPGR